MNNISHEEQTKFNNLLAKWLLEGKLYISPRPNGYGEQPQDNLDIILEFSGGGERIGNDDSGSFTWNDIFNMAKDQKLL